MHPAVDADADAESALHTQRQGAMRCAAAIGSVRQRSGSAPERRITRPGAVPAQPPEIRSDAHRHRTPQLECTPTATPLQRLGFCGQETGRAKISRSRRDPAETLNSARLCYVRSFGLQQRSRTHTDAPVSGRFQGRPGGHEAGKGMKMNECLSELSERSDKTVAAEPLSPCCKPS